MLTLRVAMETDCRWLAEVPELPGVLAYGANRDEAIRRAQSLALRVLADRLDHGEAVPGLDTLFPRNGAAGAGCSSTNLMAAGSRRRQCFRLLRNRALIVLGGAAALLGLVAMLASFQWLILYEHSPRSPEFALSVHGGTFGIRLGGYRSPISYDSGWQVWPRESAIHWWEWRWEASDTYFAMPIWCWIGASAAFAAIGIACERRRRRPSTCHNCGYDLAGLPPAVACPECGTPRPTPKSKGS